MKLTSTRNARIASKQANRHIPCWANNSCEPVKPVESKCVKGICSEEFKLKGQTGFTPLSITINNMGAENHQ